MPATVECNECEEEVSTSLLKQHLQYFCAAVIEKQQKTALKCPLCHEVFDKLDVLQKHRAEHQETSMILEYAERAGFIPGNLLDLLRNTLLTDHDLGADDKGKGGESDGFQFGHCPNSAPSTVEQSTASPETLETPSAAARTPITPMSMDTRSTSSSAEAPSDQRPSARRASGEWTRAVAVNKNGNKMRPCGKQKEVESMASLDNFFRREK